MKNLFTILLLLFVTNAFADNEINIEQTGDNLDLKIDQIGSSNIVQMLDNNSYINSSSLDIWIVQYNFGYENKIAIDEISGTGNNIKLAQGAGWDSDGWTTDGYESGGHYIEMDLYGNNNEIQWHQTNQTGSTDGHNFNLHIAGSDNSIIGRQQSDGVKEMELTIYNSFNDVLLRQKGNNATHSADIILDGLYGTDFTLKQLGSTTQSYSISIDCLNPAGCSYNVQQGN